MKAKNWLYKSLKKHLKSEIESLNNKINETDKNKNESQSENDNTDMILSLHHNILPIDNILPDAITQHVITFTDYEKRFQLLRISVKSTVHSVHRT